MKNKTLVGGGIAATIAIIATMSILTGTEKTYYFSESGNDAGAGTLASPWKTMAKMNGLTLAANDKVLLNRGSVFYGALTLKNSGVVFDAYGAGEKPVITSMISISGWTSVGNGVWESGAYTMPSVQVVTLNGIPQRIGRWPNVDAAGLYGGYNIIESTVDHVSITDNELPGSPSWAGADIVLRTSRWTLDKYKVTAHAGTKITYAGNTANYAAKVKYGYFIQNHPGTLDKLGEWYFNPTTKKLRMYSGASAPANVQAASLPTLLISSSISSVQINNISFQGSNDHITAINGGSGFIFKGVDFLYSGIDGFKSSSHNNLTLDSCRIMYAYNNGINSSGSNNHILNNLIYKTYYMAGMGQSGNGQGWALRGGTSALVQYNKVVWAGYVGIGLGQGIPQILNNYVDSTSMIKDDGGSIYDFVGTTGKIWTGRLIEGNVLINGIGNGDGTPNPLSRSAEGIYLDDQSNGVIVKNNLVANIANNGIFFHNSRNISATGNFVYNCGTQILFNDDGIAGEISGHTTYDNTFIAAKSTQYALRLQDKDVDNIATFGIFDRNKYIGAIRTISYLYKSNQIVNNLTFAQWKTKYSEDANSSGETALAAPMQLAISDTKPFKWSIGGVAGVIPITVSISTPAKAKYLKGDKVLFTAATSEGVDRVEFYANNILQWTEQTFPWTFTYSIIDYGNYTITAKAIDIDGGTAMSSPINIVVIGEADSTILVIPLKSGDTLYLKNFKGKNTKLEPIYYENIL